MLMVMLYRDDGGNDESDANPDDDNGDDHDDEQKDDDYKSLLTAISSRTHRISFDLRSQAA